MPLKTEFKDPAPPALKVRLLTLDNMDHRTHAARLAHALIEEIETDLGGSENLSTGMRQIVKRAAVLGAYVENAEVRWLSGLEIDTAEYLMAVNVQRRLLVTLGLDRRSKLITPTLRDYLSDQASKDRGSLEKEEAT
jgi:hypothetical protein